MACIRTPDEHSIPFTFPFPGSLRAFGCILSCSNQSALAAVRTVTCCSTSSLARNFFPCVRACVHACMCVCIDALEKNKIHHRYASMADLLACSRGTGRSATRPDLEPPGPAWAASRRCRRHGSCMSERHRAPCFEQVVQGQATMSRVGGGWCSPILLVSSTGTITRQTRSIWTVMAWLIVIAVDS